MCEPHSRHHIVCLRWVASDGLRCRSSCASRNLDKVVSLPSASKLERTWCCNTRRLPSAQSARMKGNRRRQCGTVALQPRDKVAPPQRLQCKFSRSVTWTASPPSHKGGAKEAQRRRNVPQIASQQFFHHAVTQTCCYARGLHRPYGKEKRIYLSWSASV